MSERGGQVAVSVSAGLVVVLAALVAGPVAPGVGLAAADHDPAGTDFTYEPMSAEDRQPGAEDTRVGTIGRAADGVGSDFETLLQLRSVYSEGSWAGCGPTSSEVFGIDRGGDNDRWEVDESLEDNVKRFSAGEDVFEAEFYDEDEFGPSTHLDSEDRVVSIIECVDNPEEPGWYRIDVASVKGRTTEGDVVTFEDASHYFWICDCEDEAEARERLGPPPSDPDPTATPSADPSDDGGSSDDADGGDAGSTSTAGGSTGGSDDASGGDGADGDESAATPTPSEQSAVASTPVAATTTEEWAAYRVNTPTVSSGAGVSPAVTAVVLVAALLLYRRR